MGRKKNVLKLPDILKMLKCERFFRCTGKDYSAPQLSLLDSIYKKTINAFKTG